MKLHSEELWILTEYQCQSVSVFLLHCKVQGYKKVKVHVVYTDIRIGKLMSEEFLLDVNVCFYFNVWLIHFGVWGKVMVTWKSRSCTTGQSEQMYIAVCEYQQNLSKVDKKRLMYKYIKPSQLQLSILWDVINMWGKDK